MKVLRRGDQGDPAPAEPDPRPAGPPPATPADRRRHRRSRADIRYSPYAFVAPFFVLFGVFGLFPMVYTAYISMHDWELIGGNLGYVGFANYAFLFTDPKFYNALLNTVGIFMLAVVPQLVLALAVADFLNRRMRFGGLFRVLVILPYVTSVAAIAIVFGQLFGSEYGLINYVLSWGGLDPVGWREGRLTSWAAISVMIDWRWVGYNALIYLAAMQAVPKDMYEAAAIDGASRLRQFWQITIPLLRPTVIFTVIMSTIGQMQLFTEPVLFGGNYQGGSQGQYQTIAMLMFDEGFRYGDYGYGAAVAWVLFVIIVLFSLLNILITSRIKSA
ncbi:cellobiose ABC transporter membrane protein [Murinocardiopsis flavida]|uniref:Cellobiose ABC transporter membrane protein n=1 Tax=Murinocardiopsis flavida TaxID=645275 RepID=A0A2P8DGU5_9ACTN|nr:cellobiose ABC transporter membrane protein [Murinocardiopsis flavida]